MASVKASIRSVAEKDWAKLAEFIIRRFIRQECQKTAAALTYTTLFALVPLITVAYGIMSALPSTEDARSGIQELLFNNLLPESSRLVSDYLSDFAQQARNLTVVGVAFLVVTAILMMKAIERAFNGIWSIAEDRKGASSFLLYWSVLTLGPILMGSGLAVTSFVVSHRLFLDATDSLGITAVLLGYMPLLTSSMAFMMLFYFVPKTHVRLSHAWLGGIFTAICFELAKWVFTQFVSQSPSYQMVYGAFAAVPLFLLWIYISWNILLLGATLVMALGNYRAAYQAGYQEPFIVALQVLQSLYHSWKNDQPVTDDQLQHLLSPLDIRQQREMSATLQQAGLLVQVRHDPPVKGRPKAYWQLGRDLSGLTLWQLFTLLPWPVPASILPQSSAAAGSPKEGCSLLDPSAIKVLQEYLQVGQHHLQHPADRLFESRHSPEKT